MNRQSGADGGGRVPRVAAIVAAAIAIVLVAVGMPRVWFRVYRARISIDGKVSAQSRLYKAADGRDMVLLYTGPRFDGYIVCPPNRLAPAPRPGAVADIVSIGDPSSADSMGDDLFVWQTCVLSLEPTVRGESMPGLEVLVDPRLRLNRRGMSFRDTDDRLVAISW
jgi:hypothetical protein